MGERSLRTALASGVLQQIWRGVVVDAARAGDLRTRAVAAALATGKHAVVSGPTAVALHGMSAADTAETHLTVPYSRSARSRSGLVIHQNRFGPGDVIEFDGLRVFHLDYALAELLCDYNKRTAFASLDQALAGLAPEHDVELRAAIHRRLTVRDDRRGVTQAEMLTELATGKADSPPESWLRLLVVEAGFPVPEAQFQVLTVDGRLLYVLDMAWPERRIALEYDGFAAHEDRKDYDAERDARLAGRGWIVIRVSAADLSFPARILAEIRAAFEQRK